MAKFHQGHYLLKNPGKYVGNVGNVYFRSSWEKKFMIWADNNPGVVKWCSEELVVPYISPKDNKPHRYFIDFVIMVQTRTGEVKKYAVEIKPEAQTKPPKNIKNKNRLITESITYAVNQAKWEAADKACKKMDMEFIVLTERHLKV